MKILLRRLFSVAVTVLLVSAFTFFAFQLISGDPAEVLLGTNATPERVEALRAELGLDQPLVLRYLRWLRGFFTGDLGVSYRYKQPVWELLQPKIEVTFCMSAISFLLIVLFSLPLGLLAAHTKNRALTAAHTAFNQLCMAVPPFALGIAVSWGFGIVLRLFMPGSFPSLRETPARALTYLFFAAVCIAVPRIAMTVRLLRASLLEESRRDYVRASLARGASPFRALTGHVLKNALVPTVTFLGQTMAEIVGAGIVVEQVFAVPGLGRILVSSVSGRDYPVVAAAVVLLACAVVFIGAAADLVNRLVDPRLRLERRNG